MFLDDELQALLAETNDQRRVAGQALWHFYRSLVFWREKGRTFFEITQAWAESGALIFGSQAAALRRLSPHRPDARLRDYVAGILEQLADDLERGDHLLVPFLRWIEGKFPELTQMMKEETVESRIYDYALAQDLLARRFGACTRASRSEAIAILRSTVSE